MSETPFIDYALASALDDDETYTVELLIEQARSRFEKNYWGGWGKRDKAREAPGYQPGFSREHAEPAAEELKKMAWVSLQRLSQKSRPVRSLRALRHLPSLRQLVLINNEIVDLAPLLHCPGLRELDLTDNQIHDLSPLANCVDLEELNITGNPVADLSVLESLPNLKTLEISVDQLPAFRRLKQLPSLCELEIEPQPFDSFQGFPAMPRLRRMRGAEVESLAGLELFPALENLANFSGEFDSLEPLRQLKRLTHAYFGRCRVTSLEPLARLAELRSLWISVETSKIDLTPLESLPLLHDLSVQCRKPEHEALVRRHANSSAEDAEFYPDYKVDHPALTRSQAKLSSWDAEFYSKEPPHLPSLELVVVDQATFDEYDTRKPYGIKETDGNKGLLDSELQWLDNKLETVLSADFEEDEDYSIPFQWAGARSRTVMLISEKAVQAFARLVSGMQKVLCHSRHDWIIYFQSEEDDFMVWIYPSKIMTTAKYACKVRHLLKTNPG